MRRPACFVSFLGHLTGCVTGAGAALSPHNSVCDTG